MPRDKQYSQEHLKSELERLSNSIEQKFPAFNREHINNVFDAYNIQFSTRTIPNRFDKTTSQVLKDYGIIMTEDERLEYWADLLADHEQNTYTLDDLCDGLPGFQRNKGQKLADHIQENRDDLKARRIRSGRTGFLAVYRKDRHRYQNYIDLLTGEREHELFHAGYSAGKSPRGITAAVLYVCRDNLSQQEAADKAGATTVTLRNCRDFLRDNGFLD